VILVIAGRVTARATRSLLGEAARHGPPAGNNGVSVLEPAGLSAPGWAHDPEDPVGSRALIDCKVTSASDLTAVITALDEVAPGDIPHIRAADRAFVAAEMTAFLRGWLTTLACPVVDPPTTLALSGRAADRAVWSAAAASAGVSQQLAFPVPGTRVITVNVVAGQIVGPQPAPSSASAALAVAQAAEVTGARLTFTDDEGKLVMRRAVPWWHVPGALALNTLLADIQQRAPTTARSAP
jgi:hypothetical protein